VVIRKKADFTYFLVSDKQILGGKVIFSAEESRHIVKVCRIESGDTILATDGKGCLYKIKVESTTKSEVGGTIVETINYDPPDRYCHLAMPLATVSKTDWVIEKCTEIGITGFHYFVSEKSTGKSPTSIRVDRFRRVALSAIKQSMRTFVPTFELHNDLNALSKVFEQYNLVIWGHLDKNAAQIGDLLSSAEFQRILVIVGPEAGFSGPELTLMKQAGAIPIRYGEHRLRMETAAVVLPALVMDSLGG